jgi:uncharacterized membrane protein YecN with MAPEG domain
MSFQITAVYAALLGLLLVILSVRVVGVRRTKRVSLGDGDDADLRGRIRAHANFTEYTPMALLLMAFAESLGAAGLLVHGTGVALLGGRLAHAVAISPVRQNMLLRVTGMSLTFAALIVAAGSILVLSFN